MSKSHALRINVVHISCWENMNKIFFCCWIACAVKLITVALFKSTLMVLILFQVKLALIFVFRCKLRKKRTMLTRGWIVKAYPVCNYPKSSYTNTGLKWIYVYVFQIYGMLCSTAELWRYRRTGAQDVLLCVTMCVFIQILWVILNESQFWETHTSLRKPQNPTHFIRHPS